MTQGNEFLSGRLLVVAFEGWNDAGEAATGALRLLQEQLDVEMMTEVDTEDYYDFAFNRPVLSQDEDGTRRLIWPGTTLYGPTPVSAGDASADDATADSSAAESPVEAPIEEADDAGLAGDAQLRVRSDNTRNIYLLVGTEPSRNWKRFTDEVIGAAQAAGVSGVVLLGAMLADVPHTRPISINVSSENPGVREQLGIERSTYEGPVGILSVLAEGAENRGIPTVSIWASVPHYVHNAPSPKATLALIDKLEELVDVVIPRGTLIDEASVWEAGVDALANDDDEMAGYIRQLEQARDTVDSPEASGEAIAQEFERYLRKRGDGKPGEDKASNTRSTDGLPAGASSPEANSPEANAQGQDDVDDESDDADDDADDDDGFMSDSSCADMEDAEEARNAPEEHLSPEERAAAEQMRRDRDERERASEEAFARFEAEQQEVELLAEMEYAAEEAAAEEQDERDQATLDSLEPEEEQDWHDAEQDPPAK